MIVSLLPKKFEYIVFWLTFLGYKALSFWIRWLSNTEDDFLWTLFFSSSSSFLSESNIDFSPRPSSILSIKLRLNSPISFYSPTNILFPKSSTNDYSTYVGSTYFLLAWIIYANSLEMWLTSRMDALYLFLVPSSALSYYSFLSSA
jgi:hypothetical protein